MLKMENVSKAYHHRGRLVKALDGATLHLAAGDFVSVVGSSGSGKSTLLLMLGGMFSPSEGRVLLEAKSVYDLSPADRARMRRDKVGFVFQTFNLIPACRAGKCPGPPFSGEGGRKVTGGPRRKPLGTSWAGRPARPQARRVERRPAAARGPGTDAGQRSHSHSRRRADGQSRPGHQPADHRFPRRVHQEGRTIVMVTHDPRAAELAKRTLRLQDGAIHGPE